MRRRSRLDRVRMIIVHSVDFIFLLPLTGLVGVVALLGSGAAETVPVIIPIVVTVFTVAFYVLSTRPFRVAVRGGRAPVAVLAVSGVIALLICPFNPFVASVWLAMLAPFVRRWIVVLLSVLFLAVYSPVLATVVEVPVVIAMVVVTAIVVAGVPFNLWLWRLAKEAHEGQEARAGLAVSEARLRFAGDLNDLLGQSLTDISARTAAAEELLATDPEAAAREMLRIRELTRTSLREVRSAVQGYRALDLDEVLASVRAVLEAADVRTTVEADTGPLPAEARTLLAGVVREGATNVLKHSTAAHCTITIKDGVLEMSNDGVDGPAGVNGQAAAGLRGLAQRLTAAGGSLTAEPEPGGRYLLRALVRQAGEGA
ncbi:sensor histidine kinase [Nonomuraea sp. NPDC050536]|uniref:sensor histidine kinase n=1 Tax=Nonomuraea sp. NPDC050536 TaxID=3364366 RepID=UPI0037CADCFA